VFIIWLLGGFNLWRRETRWDILTEKGNSDGYFNGKGEIKRDILRERGNKVGYFTEKEK
jgi:hypothetical protein